MRRAVVMLALALGACAPAKPGVKLDETSAAGHRREAARERMLADDDYARYQPTAVMPTPGAVGSTDVGTRYVPIDPFPFNPTDRAVREAERHLRHAREHESAARLLERYENAECGPLSPKARAACPMLGPVLGIVDLPDGVRITFAADAPVDGILAQMRCHLAFARARGFTDAGDCPLYMRGVEMARSSDGRAIDVRSSDGETARRIKIDSRVSN